MQTIDTVYVFNVELDMRDKPPNVTAKDGSALEKNPLQDVRVREAIDLAIDRKALAEVAMEGLGKPVNQMVTPSIFGYNKSLGERKYDPAAARKLLAEAGYPNGFRIQFSFTSDRLPGDRQVGTSIAQMLAGVGIDAQANAVPAAVFFPARARGEYSMSMSGWGTLTGEANYTLSSLAHSGKPRTRSCVTRYAAHTNVSTVGPCEVYLFPSTLPNALSSLTGFIEITSNADCCCD